MVTTAGCSVSISNSSTQNKIHAYPPWCAIGLMVIRLKMQSTMAILSPCMAMHCDVQVVYHIAQTDACTTSWRCSGPSVDQKYVFRSQSKNLPIVHMNHVVDYNTFLQSSFGKGAVKLLFSSDLVWEMN